MSRVVLWAALMIALAGCMTTPEQAKEQKKEPLKPPTAAEVLEKAKATVETCRTKFSESPSDAISRAACFNDADTLFRNFARFPDLVDGRIAKRTILAKEMADGKITRQQAVQEFVTFNRSLVGEEVRRLKAKTPRAAQEKAAAEGAALF